MKRFAWLTISAIVLFALAIGGYWLLKPKDLRAALAHQLAVPKEREQFFFINMPPRPYCYPGTILSSLGPTLARTTDTDSNLQRGPQVSFSATQDVTAKFTQSLAESILNGAIQRDDLSKVILTVADLRVITRDGDQLKQLALRQDTAIQQYDERHAPIIILTAYEGTIELKMDTKASASGSAKLDTQKILKDKGFSVESTVEGNGTETLKIKSDTPIVFAYEAASIRYSAMHLGPRPDTVDLIPLKAQ